jgi:putative flippase GtrA
MLNWTFNIFFKFPQGIRYILIGGWNTVFSLALFIAIYTLFQNFLHYMVVAVLCHILSVIQSFLTLKYFVFQTKGNFWREYIRINITYIGALLLNLSLLYIFCDIYELDPRLASIINAFIIAFLSYFLHKFFTFKANHISV